MFDDDSIKALALSNNTLNNTESDSYGRIGRQDYKTSLDLNLFQIRLINQMKMQLILI